MILTIDTTSEILSVGIFEEDNLVFEFSARHRKKQLSLLVPTVKYFFDNFNKKIENLKLIAITTGPGSFTGIRLGISFVKTLSQIYNIPIVGISSLEVIAKSILNFNSIICPIIDAKKGNLYYAIFKKEKHKLIRLKEDSISDIEKVIERCKDYKEKIIFGGDGVKLYKETISKELKNVKFAETFFWYPISYYIKEIAKEKFEKGNFCNFLDLKPVYLYKIESIFSKGS